MLSETQFKKYITFSYQLSPEAKEYIKMVRNSEPSRTVGSHAQSNVCSWIPSNKMGVTISTDSRGPEKTFAIMSEYDEQVLEYWEQPEPIKVERFNKNGHKQSGTYTPDFLVLSKIGPRIIQVKPKSVLEDLVKTQPKNWVIKSDGSYEYLPAKVGFEKLGLIHEVFVADPDQGYLVQNLEILLCSRSEEIYDSALPLRVKLAFEESFSWSLFDLKNRLGLTGYTSLVQMVDEKKFFCDLHTELLTEPMGCFVAQSERLVEEAKGIRKENKIYSGFQQVSVHCERLPSYRDAPAALEKLEKLEKGDAPARSIRRWKKQVAEGAEQGLTPFQSLIPKTYLSGNRIKKVNKVVLDFLVHYLMDNHALAQGISMYRSYIRYKELAYLAHPGFDAVSRLTFSRRLAQIPESVIAKSRKGKRAANAAADPTDPIKRSLRPQIPWQSAAIDHYKADIYLIYYSNLGVVYVDRPWVTGMIDLATGKILAITLSFKAPSRNSCAKVIRECVRLHRRLPNEIIVDRGSDFTSVYFSSLLAHYRVTLSLRPVGHARFGGEIEGLFGEFKKQWLSQRKGNLADYKEARSVDGKLQPKMSAILRPYDLYGEMKAFSSWRDSKPKNNQLESSAERFERGQDEFPFVGVRINYNEEFLLATSVKSKEYSVDFQRGIHIDELFYYSPNITKVRGKKSKLEVRRDPENPYVIYAFIDDRWESCYATKITSFAAQDPAMQFETGLVAIEGSNLRRQVREECDIELARMIREMDEKRDDGKVPIVPIAMSEEDSTEDDLLNHIDLNNLRVLSVGEW